MPKKNGVQKTYSFSKETVKKLQELCDIEDRSQTNMIERLVSIEYKEKVENKKGD